MLGIGLKLNNCCRPYQIWDAFFEVGGTDRFLDLKVDFETLKTGFDMKDSRRFNLSSLLTNHTCNLASYKINDGILDSQQIQRKTKPMTYTLNCASPCGLEALPHNLKVAKSAGTRALALGNR